MATTKKFRVKHGLDAGNNTISFVNDPVSANDAATKNYVDTVTSSLGTGDVSNSYLTSTFTTNTDFQSYVANTNSRIDTLEAGGTLVTNSYLTSTFTTNTDFQSFVANTNAYIATKTDDTTVLATNTALRTLIDDRIQVANATLLIDDRIQVANATLLINDRMQVANVISYVDTEIAALVNSAPTTLDTLNELAAALGDDANFSTTVTTNLGQKLGATATVTLTGDVTGSGSFSSNAVSIALTDTNLANTNAYIASVDSTRATDLANTNSAIADRMQVANVVSYTTKYLEVANVASNTSTSTATFTSGNSTITFTRDDSSTYDVNLSTFAMANTSTSNAVYTVANSTITFTRADSSTFDVVVDSASVEVSNTAPSGANEGDMWWDNATGELYIYYSNNWVEAVAQDVTPYANNGTFSSSNNTITFVRTDGSQFDVVLTGVGEVTNAYVTSTYTTNAVFQSALANTNAYIATKTDDSTVLATNTALRTLIDDRMQVANTNLLVNDRIQVANADAKYATWASLTSTNTAIRSYVDTEVAALVNSAPTTLDTLVELASALGNDANFSTTVLTLIGTKASNSALTSTYVTNTVFQSALANTNSYIATKTDDTTVLATNTALRTLISDRIQVANVTGTYVTNTVFQSALANTNARFAGLGTGDVSNSYLTSTFTTNTVFQSALANTNAFIATKTDDTVALATNTALRILIDDRVQVANLNTTLADYWPSANVINYTAKYLEVANSSTGTSVTVSNSAPTITANGELWWDNVTGELYVSYSSSWVEAVAQDVTPYANNGTFSSSNNTITFVRTDGSQFDVVLTGVGEVTNSYVTSTFTTNTAFQSALANTNAYIATKADSSSLTAYLEVANLSSYGYATESYVDTEVAAIVNSAPTLLNTLDELANALNDDANFATTVTTNLSQKLGSTASVTLTGDITGTASFSANALSLATTDTNLANTNAYIATKTDDTTVLATNTALRTLISDRIQVANLNTTLADYWPSANIITYTAKYLEVANSVSGATLEVGNTSPSSPTEGDLWYDTDTGIINIYIGTSWVESTVNFPNFAVSNSYITSTYVSNTAFQAFVANTNAAIASSQGEVSNAYLTSTFTTNTVFQSALANTNLAISDRMQVANVEAYLANTNSYIATESARIDLVNTNLTGTNTALRTLISDRIQVANAETRFLRKDGTASQSVGGQVTFSDNVIISGNLTVSGTRTEVNTEQLNVSNTYILLNSDLGSGTAATENAGLIVNRGSEANVYFRWNETEEYWEYGEADGTFTSVKEATTTIIDARNESGSTIDAGTPVYVSGYNGGGARPLVEPADADDPTKMPALGLALETVTTGNNIRVASYGVYENANTGVFSEGDELYIDTTAGKLTASRPSGNSTKIQKIGQVLRSHASAGTILIQGAGRSNDIPNLSNLNVFIGNTSGVGTTRQLQYSDLSDVGYVTANTISIKNPANYHEYTVTVDTKTSAHPYSGGSSSAYFLDSVESPSIVLAPNQTYRFDQSDSTNSSHPLDFYVDADKNTAYTTGVTVSGTAGSAGAYTEIVVDEDTPQVLYYQCQNHSYMGSVASILSDTSPKYLEVANVASNTSTTSASLTGNTATFTRADSSTFTLDLSGIASAGGGGASVTVANTAPVSPTEGDLYFDNELATMFIYYDSSWVEVQPTIDPINPLTYGLSTFTANGTATDFTHTSDTVSADAMLVTVDGIIQRPTTDYTVSNKTVTFGTAPSNTSIVAVRVTTGAFTGVSNATFQSALANTNAYIASVAPSYFEVTSNTTMSAGTKYIVGTRTANVVLTFPTSASLGDEIRILDGTGQADTYGIELNRNGHRIQGELANVVIDTSRAAGGYVYYNANNGWILTEV